MTKTLYEHQKETIEKASKVYSFLDASDPGTGKTLSALCAWENRRKEGGGKLLVVAPRALLESVWGEQIKEYMPDCTYSVARSTNREKAFNTDSDIYITNIEGVNWIQKNNPAELKNIDTIIIDESSYFKNNSTRTKNLLKIGHRFKYKFSLSATPSSKSITDIFRQILFLDRGERLGKSFYKFQMIYCFPIIKQINGFSFTEWKDKKDAAKRVFEKIEDISIRHELQKSVSIPENHEYTILFKMNSKHQKIYTELEKLSLLNLKTEVVALNKAQLNNKLLQVASGAVYASDGTYEELDTDRYSLILDTVEAREHSLVFFCWKHQKEGLIKEAKKRKISYAVIDGSVSDKEREMIVATAQKGWYQVLFLHPKTGAHGLTLTKATATIWASPIYEADLLKQGKHRIWRSGQKKRTENILIHAENTIEQSVYNKMYEKSENMFDLLNYLSKKYDT